MAKNDILYKCRTEVDEDMIEVYTEEGNPDFDPEVNKVFSYIYKVNPIVDKVVRTAYTHDQIEKVLSSYLNSDVLVYTDEDYKTHELMVRYTRADIEGSSAKNHDKNRKEAIEAFEEFLQDLENLED